MIMQRQADGSYAHIGFIKTPTEAVDKVIDKNGDLYFEQGYNHQSSGYPLTLTDGIGKPLSDYKIYGNIQQDGTPTPEAPVEVLGVGNKTDNGYEIPVVCRGKNLFDEQTIYKKTESFIGSDDIIYEHIKVGDGVFTMSSTFVRTTSVSNLWFLPGAVYAGANTSENGVYSGRPVTVEAAGGKVTIAFRRSNRYGPDPSTSQTQIELGSTATEYEPYHEPTTTTITLPQPLYKGDYLTKDKSGGKVHRAWGVKIYDGTEDWRVEKVEGYNNFYDYIPLENARKVSIVRCSHQISFDIFVTDENCRISGTGRFNFQTTMIPHTVNDFKSFLTSEYAKGTPVTVCYPLATPTKESIELPDIPTFDGTTIIETNTELSPLSIEATYKANKPTVYGYHINPNEPDSFNAVTYLEDAVGMTPAKMGADIFDYGSWQNAFFMPKPCMLKYDGTVAYYLDPNDYSRKLDGTPSDIANPDFEGNAMMEWGLIWYKFAGGAEDGEGYFYVSDHRVDDSYHCWCNYDADNNIIPHFYTAIYNGTGIEKLRSISGVTLTSANGNGNTTGEQEITRALANNTTEKVEWYTDVYADRELINALHVLISKSINTQASFGRGLDTGNRTSKEAYITGTLDKKGLFYGVTANGNSAVKTFGMENWWGCVWHRTAGCVLVDGDYKVKLTYGTADGTTESGYNSTGEGYVSTGTMQLPSGYANKFKYSEKGYMPFEVNGSASTYYADYFYHSSETRYLLVGGYANSDIRAGAFFFALNGGFSDSTWITATALSCKPSIKKAKLLTATLEEAKT